MARDSQPAFSLDGANVLIPGGTGSLGSQLCRQLMSNVATKPATITIMSRDEAKQHFMRIELFGGRADADDLARKSEQPQVRFVIGDVRNYSDMRKAVDRADVIFHAAAMKQVPACEYFGRAAVDTNVYGAINLARAISEGSHGEKHVIGISSDKACEPVSVMGMTKAIQERIFIQAALDAASTRFVNVRYGNVIASRGSVVPLFADIVRRGDPLPITDERMTRFLMTLDESVELVLAAFANGRTGETWVPLAPTARLVDLGLAVAGSDDYPIRITGIRPGEKIHETLISEEETPRTSLLHGYAVIAAVLPELWKGVNPKGPLPFTGAYTSAHNNLDREQTRALLRRHQLAVDTARNG